MLERPKPKKIKLSVFHQYYTARAYRSPRRKTSRCQRHAEINENPKVSPAPITGNITDHPGSISLPRRPRESEPSRSGEKKLNTRESIIILIVKIMYKTKYGNNCYRLSTSVLSKYRDNVE